MGKFITGDRMAICTFFGHKDTPQKIEPILRTVIIDLIENENVTSFYVGNNGNFDNMVRKTLKSLKSSYSYIHYAVILAYMPQNKNQENYNDYSDSVFPEEFENILPKYAIVKRNNWMLNHSDYVVSYITHTWGGAAQFKELAEKKGKIVINLAEMK